MRTTSTAPATAALATVVNTGQNILAPGSSGLAVLDTISKQDIVAIVRNEHETRLAQEQAESNQQLNKLNTRLATLNAEIDKIAMKAVDTVDLESAEAAAKALNQTFGCKASATVALQGREDERRRFIVVISVSKPGSYSGVDTIATKTLTVPYSSAAIDLLRDIKIVQKEIKNIQVRLIEIKRDICDLPALERRAHAELAKSVLAGSKDGMALLQRLRASARPVQTVDVESAVAA